MLNVTARSYGLAKVTLEVMFNSINHGLCLWVHNHVSLDVLFDAENDALNSSVSNEGLDIGVLVRLWM